MMNSRNRIRNRINFNEISTAIDRFINSNHRGESDRIYGDMIVRQQIEKEEREKEDPVERRKRLADYFENNAVSMLVTEESFPQQTKKRSDSNVTFKTEAESEYGSDVDTDEELPMQMKMQKAKSNGHEENELYIPKVITHELDGKEVELTNGGRKVPDCCAICLCEYDVNDSITWSVNKNCTHAFHTECILDYLQGQKSTPCPCCRSEFTYLLPKPKDGKYDERGNDSGTGTEGGSFRERTRQASRAFTRRLGSLRQRRGRNNLFVLDEDRDDGNGNDGVNNSRDVRT